MATSGIMLPTCKLEMLIPDFRGDAACLERVVKIGRHSGIWYIGAQSGPHETKCNVGFAILGG